MGLNLKKERTLELLLTTLDNVPVADLSIPSLASRCGLSVWHLQRLFHGLTSQTLGNYIRGRRLSIAAEALKFENKGILDIALDCGFNSHEAFTRSFQNYFGESPREFRSRKPPVTPLAKPIISAEYVRHIGQQSLDPEIRSIPARILLGLDTIIPSPLEKGERQYEALLALWKEFLRILPSIPNKRDDALTGLIRSESGANEESELKYFASCEVESLDRVPENLMSLTLPAQSFAVFKNVGGGNSTVHLVDYIYGTWLNDSGYIRAHGDDFETFSPDFKFFSPQSISFYHVPIATKA